MRSVLFLSRAGAGDQSAYTHRLHKLQSGLEAFGVKTGIYHLGDDPTGSHTLIPFYIPKLSKLFCQYDYIHAGGTPCAFVACVCKPFHGKKVIYDNHGDYIREAVQNRSQINKHFSSIHISVLKAFLQELIAVWFSDYFLAVSKPLGKLMRSRGANPKRLHLIRNGVDLKLFSPFPHVKQKSNSLTITYAGQFQNYQAIDDFIEAARRNQNSSLRYRIIGFSKTESSLKNEFHRILGKNVELFDMVSQKELVSLLRSSDILVIPRKPSPVTEIAFPTKFAEYLAMGKPVIVSSVDETAEFVESNHCGYVYNGCAPDLSNLFKKIGQSDRTILKKMGEKGRKLSETTFDWGNITRAYYDHIICKKNISAD